MISSSDQFSRVYPALKVSRSTTALDIVTVLEHAVAASGKLRRVWVDQGSQFTASETDLWADTNSEVLDFSRPGKPMDNAFIEAFNARFRVECLNQHWFLNLGDAQEKAKACAKTTME